MTQATRKPKEFTGKHMLLSILAFFGVIVAVNLTLAFFATGSWTGLIVKNSYVASQEYNDVLEAAKAQDAMGWSSQADYADGVVSFRLQDKTGNAVTGWQVKASLTRPTHENDDHGLTLAAMGDGGYQGVVELAPGAWNLEIDAVSSTGQTYRQIYRLWADPDA
ncbi:MAG: FixH family protein [Alphaproteobacteria bacterium]